MRVIVYQSPDTGRAAIVTPVQAGLSDAELEELAASAVPEGVEFNIVDKGTLPASREFRNAWKVSGNAVGVDLEAAKVIKADALRAERAPLLTALDAAYMKALEANDMEQLAAIAARKQVLRDAPSMVSAVTSVEALSQIQLP